MDRTQLLLISIGAALSVITLIALLQAVFQAS